MKNINSRYAVLVLAFALLWFLPRAQAQGGSGDAPPPRCTDLSGKIPLPCPASNEPGNDTATAADQWGTPPPRIVGDLHRDHREPREAGKAIVTPGASNASPAEQPRGAALRPAVVSQPSTPVTDPRTAIGLHPRTPPEPAPDPAPVTQSSPASRLSRSPELSLFRNLVQDQKDIWTSPLRLRLNDVQWLAPLLAAGAVTVLSDTDIQRHLPTSTSLQTRSKSYSTYGVAAFAGATGAAWLWGRATHNDHLRETGILSGEAVLDSFALTYAIKSATHRDRPYQGNGKGTFFSNGDSFPSEHTAAAWSMATVIAHEYPGPLTTLFAYGGAAAVTAMRVTGRQHFASDALVGSAIGYFVGRHVYRVHHDERRAELAYGTFQRTRSQEVARNPDDMGSTYVALDSWVYAAIDRLAALGYFKTAFAGLRPWSRMECARLLDEAGPAIQSDATSQEADRLYRRLQAEFLVESGRRGGERNMSAEIESIYTRFTGISGPPLTDGYHFGQTIVNDYGRPYQRGFNSVTGVTGTSSVGPLAFYVRGEFQHAPSAPGYSQAVQNAVQTADGKPLIPAFGNPAINQFALLDAYAVLNLTDGWQASFGKQSLWLGPTQDPFLSSANAEPYYMFRLAQTSPRRLPFVLKYLGLYRTEFWVGRLAGHHFVNTEDGNIEVSLGRSLARQPFVDGAKVNFKPTPNLEFGVGKSGLFGGPRFPVTLRSFWRSEFKPTNSAGAGDPGDRRSTFDFSYRLPGLRKWLVLYGDSYVDDEISPIGYPRRAAQNQGLYMPQVPKIPRLDFRVEGGYTNLPDLVQPPGGGFFNWNVRYLDGYTNNGKILGNATLGRQGIAFRASSTYWFDADKNIQLGYRNMEADKMFLGGGNLRDVSLRSEWNFGKAMSLSSFLQYEWWNFPLLSAGTKQNNFTASVRFTYWPHWRISREK